MKIEIRKEKPADIDAIFSVTEKAFLNAQHTTIDTNIRQPIEPRLHQPSPNPSVLKMRQNRNGPHT